MSEITENLVHIDIEKFKPKETAPVDRVVEFLLWTSKKYPYVLAPYPAVATVALYLIKPPDAFSPEVLFIENIIERVRKVAFELHGKVLFRRKDQGVRVHVDDVDLVENVLNHKISRAALALDRISDIVDLIDEYNLPDDNPAIKKIKDALISGKIEKNLGTAMRATTRIGTAYGEKLIFSKED